MPEIKCHQSKTEYPSMQLIKTTQTCFCSSFHGFQQSHKLHNKELEGDQICSLHAVLSVNPEQIQMSHRSLSVITLLIKNRPFHKV